VPSVRWLDVGTEQQLQQRPGADWTDPALPSPVSLRRLTVAGLSLSAASVRRLCTWPLESLWLNKCYLVDGDELLTGAEQQSKCVLKAFGCCPPLSREIASFIVSQAQQVKKLDVIGHDGYLRLGHALDLSPFMTAAGGPRLPHLTEFLIWPYTLNLAGRWELAELELAFAAIDLHRWSYPQHEPTLELQVEGVPAEDRLPSLRELTLYFVPLSNASLLFLLSRCPELENVAWTNCSTRPTPGRKQLCVAVRSSEKSKSQQTK
jgi:hypothetical protein